MKIQRIIFILIFCVGLSSSTVAQVNSTDLDSTNIDSTVLQPVGFSDGDLSTGNDTTKESFKVRPWEFHAPLASYLAETDSTLRWQSWPDWTYKLSRDPGVIPYRMGTSLRSNAVQRFAHEPRHQQLYWEGIPMNDPVSGAVNWERIPEHKIGAFYNQDLGTQYRSTYYLKQYYLSKPLSRLIYSESKFSHRNLKFEVSHNLSRRTNVQLSYWDRRTGGEYPNSEVTGRQIFAKVSHHLSENQYLKLNFVNNNFDVGRPFGYSTQDLRLFPFDRFTAVANEPSAKSQEQANTLALTYYQRSADSTEVTDNLHAGIYYKKNARSLNSSTDSTSYAVKSAGIMGKKWWRIGGLSLQASANYQQFFNQTKVNGSLPADDWSLLDTEGRVTLDFTPIIDFKGGVNFKYRSDGFQSYRVNMSSDISVGPLTITPGVSSGTVMPTIQQLYWNSASYQGNPSLKEEKIQEGHAMASLSLGPSAKVGLRAQHKDIIDGLAIVDSSFVNISNYASQSAAVFFEWDPTHFEFDGSVNLHRFTNSLLNSKTSIAMDPAKRVWLKGSAYWKGYMFDRATYVKVGASGMISPFRYQADHYQPQLNIWQPVSNDQRLPFFTNVDIDISARVRSIIFELSWENVFDDVSQLGYFETAQYPMSSRRFIFGVRALFRN
ncbi:hypothetical protein LX73_0561 [Fodinibius salinus]|uniref:Porin n=1 Tax=Fodinibius salinus TaxID=860790 RepID=A0A5D3YQK3_9BACT|nr:putative porin [Fodinibius salinus]TYP95263.1 hypothetical protein LX73_0561 [Fodinibius salinus]